MEQEKKNRVLAAMRLIQARELRKQRHSLARRKAENLREQLEVLKDNMSDMMKTWLGLPSDSPLRSSLQNQMGDTKRLIEQTLKDRIDAVRVAWSSRKFFWPLRISRRGR